MGLNFTIAKPTKYSPYNILFGEDPSLPGYNNTTSKVFENE